MSRVDVLAVMDAAIDELPDAHAAPLDEARAGVAELVVAIVEDAVNRAVASGLGVSEWRAFVPAKTAAALARIGGDS